MLVPSSNTLSNISSLHSSQSYFRAGLSSSNRSAVHADDFARRDATQLGEAGSNHRQDAFERTLAMGYLKLEASFSRTSSTEPTGKVFDTGPLTAAKVAGNILGFIERRLAMDVAEGADSEALASRLAAGLEGFKKGFAEAEQQLEALNMLNPEIKEDIGETYSRVIEGIDALRAKFLGQSNEHHNDAGADLDRKLDKTTSLAESTLIASQYDFARANSFTFTLKTADGDSVRIEANSAEGFSLTELYDRSESEQGIQGSYNLSASYSQSNRFNLQVKGELDAGELKAINDLLGQVNDLASEFFSGDLDKAFNSALELGYDSSEITRYSLSLTQVEVQRVASAYANTSEKAPIPALSGLSGVGTFAQNLLDAMRTASVFDQPQNLIQQLAESLEGMQRGAQDAQEKAQEKVATKAEEGSDYNDLESVRNPNTSHNANHSHNNEASTNRLSAFIERILEGIQARHS